MSATEQDYRGRPLARPDEELTDQGLGFDLVTVLNRRNLLRLAGLGAAAVGLSACTQDGGAGSVPSAGATGTAPTSAGASTSPGEIPDETAGPYPGDGTNGPDVLEQSGIVRSDLRSSFGDASGVAEGVPMTLRLTITDLADAGQAFAGVAVYVWHCTREGGYSLYSDGVTAENFLRGVQIADAEGVVEFTSIFPACYAGRWPHIHFEIYPDQADIADASKAIATSQVALPKDVCDRVYTQTGYQASVSNLAQVSLTSDMVFGDDGARSQLASVTGDVSQGYAVSLRVPVDTRTTPSGGGMPGRGGPGGSGGPSGKMAPGGGGGTGGPPRG